MAKEPSGRLKRWSEIVILAAAVVALATTVLPRLGVTQLWPGDNITAVTHTVRQQGDSIVAHGRVIDSLRTGHETQVYLTCQVLERVSPQGAILPKDCRP